MNYITQEIWKDIAGWEGKYQVSNLGRVKSLERKCKTIYGERTVPEKILKTANDTYGYPTVTLSLNNKHKQYSIHRLVAQAFIPNPDNLPQVNHKDENKENNMVENLEWCTMDYNNSYGTRVVRGKEKREKPVLCVETGVIYKSASYIEQQLGYGQGNICNCCNGKNNSAYGFHWQYETLCRYA